MDNSNQQSMNRQIDPLGVNKLGKNITKKSPFHQPNFASTSRQQPQPQPQPLVYNINKSDFRNIVQQLTGSPSREPQPTPLQNHPTTTPSNRLHRVRPPPLDPTRPQLAHLPIQHPPVQQQPYPNAFTGPPSPSQYDQLSPPVFLPSTPNDIWTNITESPISGYMRYLQNSIIENNPIRSSTPPPTLPSPRMNGLPPVLPSPTSQFLLPSPTGFLNLVSPRSPYQLISPNFSFGPTGVLGPRPPHPPLSPGYGFPLSSPRWRNQ